MDSGRRAAQEPEAYDMGEPDAKTRAKELAEQLGEAAHHVWLAGLGALAKATEGGERMFRSLVEQGREVEARGKPAVAALKAQARGVVEDVRAETSRAVKTGKEKVKAGVAKAKAGGAKATEALKKEAKALGKHLGDLARSVRPKEGKPSAAPSQGARKPKE